MLKINCDRCMKELTEPGALMFTPPIYYNKVKKYHICVPCFKLVFEPLFSFTKP